MKYFRSMSKDKLQKTILAFMGSLIVAAAIWVLFTSSQLAARNAEIKRAATLQQKINDTERQIKVDRQEAPKRDALRALGQAQRSAIISGDPFMWCVREINLLAERYPVRLTSLRPGSAGVHRVKPQYATYGIQLELEGTFDQLGAFVQSLENHFATAEIRQLDLQALDAMATKRRVMLTLSLLVQPEATSPAGKSKPGAAKTT